jgi:hypothetical protein
LIELEMIDRERRMIERRIGDLVGGGQAGEVTNLSAGCNPLSTARGTFNGPSAATQRAESRPMHVRQTHERFSRRDHSISMLAAGNVPWPYRCKEPLADCQLRKRPRC